MSPMEQALRDEIAWHEAEIERLLRGNVYHINEGYIRDHRARLAALTAALPAPGDAGDWVTIPHKPGDPQPRISEGVYRAIRMAGHGGFEGLRVSAAPHPPVSLGEISQAQAQAMGEALVALLKDAQFARDLYETAALDHGITAAIRALSASPLPAPATPGGPDAE